MVRINITTSIDQALYNRAVAGGFSYKAGSIRKWSEALRAGILTALGDRRDLELELNEEIEKRARLVEKIAWQARRIEELEANA